MELNKILYEIQSRFIEQDKKIKILADRCGNYKKIIAKIQMDLERAIKESVSKKDTKILHSVIYEIVDLCRTNNYYSADYGSYLKVDPPMTEEEKIL